MKNKMNNSNMPVGKLIRVNDFLPPPAQLAVPEDTEKITILLKKSCVDFFKKQAQLHHTKYQKMIRELLDRYAIQHSLSRP